MWHYDVVLVMLTGASILLPGSGVAAAPAQLFNNAGSHSLLIQVAPALFFKPAFLYLPPVCMIVSVVALQCWDLTRSLGGVPCSSHWAALC